LSASAPKLAEVMEKLGDSAFSRCLRAEWLALQRPRRVRWYNADDEGNSPYQPPEELPSYMGDWSNLGP
jgi:hypothetical protein